MRIKKGVTYPLSHFGRKPVDRTRRVSIASEDISQPFFFHSHKNMFSTSMILEI